MARIVTNVFLDEVRRKRRRPTARSPKNPIACCPPSPAADEATEALSDEVQHALAALPEEFRVPVVLCDVVDLSYEQIADARTSRSAPSGRASTAAGACCGAALS